MRRYYRKFVKYSPFVIAAVLYLSSWLVDPGDGGSDKRTVPATGQSITLEVVNQGVSLRFRDKFELQLEQKVTPQGGVDMPERKPIACRFRLEVIGIDGGRSIQEFSELRYGSEYYAGGTATSGSDLFDLPEGRSSATITNLGCAEHQSEPLGEISIGPVGDHLVIPLAAMLLRFCGWSFIALGIILSIVRLVRARRTARNE